MANHRRALTRMKDGISRRARLISLKALIRHSTPYQPVGDLKAPGRSRPISAFESRWQALVDAAAGTDARNLLEVGSAEGYFVRRAARELGLFSLGLEGDWTRVRVGAALAELADDRGYGFAFGAFSADEIRGLPRFDIVVCLSVVHHVIRRAGRQGGIDFLNALGSITDKRFIFDMGGPEETSHNWATHLDFLSGDVNARIADYLREAGFTDVQIVGMSLGHRDPVQRAIFSCAPSNSLAAL